MGSDLRYGSIYWGHSHLAVKNEENGIDPDDGNSWACSACTLPIFSTPFIRDSDSHRILHDQCAHDLPEKVTAHLLHPEHPLILQEITSNMFHVSYHVSCDNCGSTCGDVWYQCCAGGGCNLRLDLLCALELRILHRSHPRHRLTAVRCKALFNCGACGTQHGLDSPSLAYWCRACGFLLHPDCASLPNAIKLHTHHHDLFLAYDESDPEPCGICEDGLSGDSLGRYICHKCEFAVHISCVIMSGPPRSFDPVLIRHAKFADLVHMPVADLETSLVPHITLGGDRPREKLSLEKFHEHPLILHKQSSSSSSSHSPICMACLEFIHSPLSFYSCGECSNFFLHSCCADLPITIRNHQFHQQHALVLVPEQPKCWKSCVSCPGLHCEGCLSDCSKFAYFCTICVDRPHILGIACALMPSSITHVLHGRSHILHMRPSYAGFCNCCGRRSHGISYACSNCSHFRLHAACARLPTTVRHEFDRHPLQLAAYCDDQGEQICEICEKGINKRLWRYVCLECDYLFHIDCIRDDCEASPDKRKLCYH